MFRGMLSLMSGLGQGYNEGAQQKLDNDRRAKLDQIALDRSAREGTEFDQAQADRADLRAAGAPVVATPDMAQTPDGPMQRMAQPAGADNIDVGQPGEAPATTPALRVGMQGMLSRDQANAALAQQNTPSAGLRREAAVRVGMGNGMAAIALNQAARQLETEGHLDFIKDNMPGVPTVDQIKAGATTFQLTGVDRFNAAGGGTIPPGATGRAKIMKLADGREVPDFEVVDANGKPLAPSARTIESMYGQTLAERQRNDASLVSERRKEGHETNLDTYRTRMADVAQQQADTNEGYRKDMGSAALAKSGSVVDRMSEADRMTFADINKQRETINAEITRARAQGLWDDKNPSQAQLLTQLNALNMRATALTGKYASGGSAQAAVTDPAGLRAKNKVTPAAQAAADSDRATILSTELATEKTRLAGATDEPAKARSMQNIAALEKEIAALPGAGKPAAGRMQAVAKPAAAAAPAPKPANAAAPLDDAGQKLDAARAANAAAAAALQKFGQRQRSENPMAYRAAVAAAEAAKAKKDEAERIYQQLIVAQDPGVARAGYRFARP